MAEGKKYNAFAGVFTPSLLTILGVIMYMRLGWVVGEAGLIAALVIIVLSHVVSVTTGLSISSIATDKKIKTGGIYYILSRSLGMPMGGSIGIALFIGTALSISLYLVGFAESFLAIDAIREFTGLSADLNGFRIIGTLVIVLLVIVAFISTSFAMKMQFVILIAIGLSLLSIALGFFEGGGISTEHISLAPGSDVSFELIFAIFFPAVTGFTAGVAMSGDLKNPKTDIPKGTIMAIGVGFAVYVLLAIGMAIFIPREDLINDYNILSKIAWLGPLVIVGVWGATLSSALGGILGGPRILQAIAKDKMSPKIFGKSYGESNEPRNALLLIFAIAEGGILIGKLDVIAGVVSMFYLASYGFINLAYVLEKWSSSDFRPTFKIHIGFGIVGFIVSFAIMFKMDATSMFAALLIMGLLYFILKRREIHSENGDVWQSVMGSVIRKTLAKMQNSIPAERNWKPNIILFSGANNKRVHLLDFGKSIIGKYGILSNFDLHEKKDSNVLFTKYEQTLIENKVDDRGVFTRRQSCNNIYEGIETIAQTYGFSGVEPNTILMGWARHAKDPRRFVQMLNHLSNLDLNVLLLDYDKTHGFGEKKQIDIWWRGAGNHGNLSLTLIKFLSNSEDWNQANIRLLIVNYENNKMEMIRKRAEEYLENTRIDAELKIINNEIEQKPFYDIMKAESNKSDLVFLGIPKIEEGKEIEFVEHTSDLMHNIGSVVLVKASSLFKELHLGVVDEVQIESGIHHIKTINKTQSIDLDIQWPKNMILAHETRLLHKEISDNFETHSNILFYQIQKDNSVLLNTIESYYNSALDSVQTNYNKFETGRQVQLLNRHQSNTLLKIHKLLEQYNQKELIEQAHLLETHLPIFIQNIKDYFSSLPKVLKIQYLQDELIEEISDSKTQKRYKWWKRLVGGKQVKYKLRFKRIVEENLTENFEPFLLEYYKRFGLVQVQFSIELTKLVKEINSSFISLSDKINKKEIEDAIFQEQKDKIKRVVARTKQLNSDIQDELNKDFYKYQVEKLNALADILNQVHPNSMLIPEDEDRPKIKSVSSVLEDIPVSWARNQRLINNASTTEIRLILLKSRIKTTLYKLTQESQNKLQTEVVNIYRQYLESLDTLGQEQKGDKFKELNAMAINISISNIYEEGNRAFNRSFTNMPDYIEVFEDEKLNDFAETQFSNIESSEISAKQLVDYLIKNKLESPLIDQQQEITKKMTESIAILNDAKRLISFAISQQDNEDYETEEGSPLEIIEDSKKKIEQELLIIEELIHELGLLADNLFNDVSQLLSYYSFVKTASNLKQYIHKQRKNSRLEAVRLKIKEWLVYLKEQQANLIYTQSKALVFKKQLNDDKSLNSPVKMLLDLTYQLSPNEQVMSRLPFYYKQLFSSTNQILHKDFWVGRAEEIRSVKASVNRYLSGYKGAIAVVGPSGIGKTFFSYYVSSLVNVPKVVSIQAQFENSASLTDLSLAFAKATEQKGSIEKILRNLPKNTIIIFENLELWWNSSVDEEDLIAYIFELISTYLDRHIFIINTHETSFKRMIDGKEYADLFLNIVKLNNIDSRQLKDVVLSRHKASGIKLNMDKQLFSELSKVKLAHFFSKLHKITEGNIEASLQLWLTTINHFENNTIELKLPEIELNNLNALDMDSRIILKQFVIYKRLNIDNLVQILKEDKTELKKKLNFLMRTGLLVKQKMFYQQNRYTKYYVTAFLQQKGML